MDVEVAGCWQESRLCLPNMAATQSETQQNEVNRDNVQQDQSSVPENVSLHNGSERSAGRLLVGFDSGNIKIKSGQNILPIAEMSQYHQESGVGSGIQNPDTNVNCEDLSKSNHCDTNKHFSHGSDQNDPGFVKLSPDNGNQVIPPGYGLPFPQRGSYHPEHSGGSPLQSVGGDNIIHQTNFGSYNPQMRHGYPGSKPLPGPGTQRPLSPNMPSTGNFGSHMQQKMIMSGQSISQQTGPTPTLNQLLKSSNPVHRYPNNYVEYTMSKQGSDQPQGSVPYSQTWPPRPLAPYGSQQGLPGFRPQAPVVSRFMY